MWTFASQLGEYVSDNPEWVAKYGLQAAYERDINILNIRLGRYGNMRAPGNTHPEFGMPEDEQSDSHLAVVRRIYGRCDVGVRELGLRVVRAACAQHPSLYAADDGPELAAILKGDIVATLEANRVPYDETVFTGADEPEAAA